jgi:hypothetical protein
MRTSDISNVQVVNYISTQVRALEIYPEPPEMSIRQSDGGNRQRTTTKTAWTLLSGPFWEVDDLKKAGILHKAARSCASYVPQLKRLPRSTTPSALPSRESLVRQGFQRPLQEHPPG